MVPSCNAKHADNFDKPDDLSAAIDEHSKKFDETDKKHESYEYVCGKWASEKGESSIFWDSNMRCLSFKESVDDSGYLHGWLDRNRDGWQARLAFDDMDENPCCSSSCDEEREYVGDIHVRLLSETAIDTQIKFDDDDEWQPPVVLTLQHRDGSSERNRSVPLTASVFLLAATRRHPQSRSGTRHKVRDVLCNGYGHNIGMDGVLRRGSCFVFVMALFGSCMESCHVRF